MIIPTSPLDSPILPALKSGKNKGHLLVDYYNFNAVLPSTKALIPNIQYY